MAAALVRLAAFAVLLAELAGVTGPVGRASARLVDDDPLADRLEGAYGREVKVLGLDIPERETIIRALEDPPAGLEELRGVLLREHEWRVREGL